MTCLDVAHTITKAAGQPLHFEEVTQRALAQKLIAPQGLTPQATMVSRLYTDAPFHDWAVQLTPAAPKRPSVGQPVG